MRTVKYTSRFRRDDKRQRSGQHSKRLDAMLLETVCILADDEPCRAAMSITRSAANGKITATATSSPT
jgi:hypothetical protein